MTDYTGKWVAYDFSKGAEVIASGENCGKVIDEARAKGVEAPAIVFVHDPEVPHYY